MHAGEVRAAAASAQTMHWHAPAKGNALPEPQRWPVEAVQQLLDMPFMDLLHQAQTVHREHWPAGEIELATLLSVKTGGCPENCGYCSQSQHFKTATTASKLLDADTVIAAAKDAKLLSVQAQNALS